MSEDFTKAVVVKRSAKQKSGYTVTETDGDYYVTGIPAKARVNKGDKIVGINGIYSGEFLDADDANDLMESIRIVVVPQGKIKEYEAAKEAEEAGGEGEEEESSEEDYEENERPTSTRKKQDKRIGTVFVGRPDEGDDESDQVYTCLECGYENINLEMDEDGDKVCEECGTILETTFPCPDCGTENVNPKPDEEGDYVCGECGTILKTETTLPCPDCGKENVNPEPDKDGDYVCDECGTILKTENQTSKADRLLTMHSDTAEKIADGQTFGDDGKPVTNPEGIQLTPADMFSPGDVITVTVGKSNPRQDAGLKIEEINGKYYIRKVPSGGLFAKTPVIAGDKILELNGKDSREYEKLSEMKKTIKDENRINVVVLRRDPDASESSASSVEFENLNVVTADGLQREGDDDYDTVGYDGHDCGCKWCPKCHKKSSGTD